MCEACSILGEAARRRMLNLVRETVTRASGATRRKQILFSSGRREMRPYYAELFRVVGTPKGWLRGLSVYFVASTALWLRFVATVFSPANRFFPTLREGQNPEQIIWNLSCQRR